jgi:hypothetical protein
MIELDQIELKRFILVGPDLSNQSDAQVQFEPSDLSHACRYRRVLRSDGVRPSVGLARLIISLGTLPNLNRGIDNHVAGVVQAERRILNLTYSRLLNSVTT